MASNFIRHCFVRLGLGAAALAVGALVLPSAALGAPSAEPDPSADYTLEPLYEKIKDANGREVAKQRYDVRPGGTVPAPFAAQNARNAGRSGVLLIIRVGRGTEFTSRPSNCRYLTRGDNTTAWCQFDDLLRNGAEFGPAGPVVKVVAKATTVQRIHFEWVDGLNAERGVLKGTDYDHATAGRDSHLSLKLWDPYTLLIRGKEGGPPVSSIHANTGFIDVNVLPPAPSTAKPTKPIKPRASASAVAAPGNGGGLPVTGSATTAVAAVGGTLLLLGGGGYLIARRRRTTFVA
ncbi:MAG TPA: LPXTG cell wall anchor domain-containing protein [Catenuloplanes sp.]